MSIGLIWVRSFDELIYHIGLLSSWGHDNPLSQDYHNALNESFIYQLLVLVCLYITQVLPVIFPLSIFYYQISYFLYVYVLFTTTFHRNSLDPFLLRLTLFMKQYPDNILSLCESQSHRYK